MKNTKTRIKQKFSQLTQRSAAKKKTATKRRRIFSLTGFIPVFPTRTELREELQYWSDLDPLRIDDLAVA